MPLLELRTNKIAERHIIDRLGGISTKYEAVSSRIEEDTNLLKPKDVLRKSILWAPRYDVSFQMTCNTDGAGFPYGTLNKIPFDTIRVNTRRFSDIQFITNIKEFKVGVAGTYQINAFLLVTIDIPNDKKVLNGSLYLKIHTPYNLVSPFTTFLLDYQRLDDAYGFTGGSYRYTSPLCLQGSSIQYLSQDQNISLNFIYNIDTGGTSLNNMDSISAYIDFHLIMEDI